MFHRITVGLKGGILRVASIAERPLLKLGGRLPVVVADGLVLPLGGCWLLDHVGETAWLWDCRQWPLALVCQWASGFGGAGLFFEYVRHWEVTARAQRTFVFLAFV